MLFVLIFSLQNCKKENTDPVVEITEPVANSQFNGGDLLFFKVKASDTDGSISKIDFYIDDVLIKSVNSELHQFAWQSSSSDIGQHTAKAVAYDNDNGTTSVNLVFEIITPENIKPTISFVKPSDTLWFVKYEFRPVSVIVEASDEDGLISKIELDVDDVLLKTHTNTDPFEYNWNCFSETQGIHVLKAVAFDNRNDTCQTEINIDLIEDYRLNFLGAYFGVEEASWNNEMESGSSTTNKTYVVEVDNDSFDKVLINNRTYFVDALGCNNTSGYCESCTEIQFYGGDSLYVHEDQTAPGGWYRSYYYGKKQ